MGDYSGLSPGVKVFTATDDVSGTSMLHPTAPGGRTPIVKPVRIGSHCMVGANSVLLPGAVMPDGAVLGSLSLLKDEAQEWAISVGIPARCVRLRSRECLEYVP